MLHNWMQQLAQEMEVTESLATAVPGTYTIPIAENLIVYVSEIPGGFSLNCQLTECPKGEKEAFFAHALRGNLGGEGTDGAVLGLSREGKRFILSRDIDYEIDYRTFRDIIEDFLNATDFWQHEILLCGAKKENQG